VSEAPTVGSGEDHSRIANHVLVPRRGTYAIDPVHTFVGFTAQHLVVGRVRGHFERVAATVTIGEEPAASSLEVTIETASISTQSAARDEDLRSARFLDTDAHPTMTYRSTGVVERPRGEWHVLGDLTVRGVTNAVPLTVRFEGSITDSWGNARAAFHARGTLTRSDFGLLAELGKEAGSMLIGDDITLDIEAEATRTQK
jgi:polyisoprenoid-binding protein YceI